MLDKLQRIEHYVPNWLLVVIALGLMIGYLLYSDPLHSVCDTQLQVFRKSQSQFLGRAPKLRLKGYSYYDEFYNKCKMSNSAGGCYPYLRGFDSVLRSFKAVDERCRARVAERPRIRKAFGAFIYQLTRLAWGDNGPMQAQQRQSWLSNKDLQLFCKIKNLYLEFYGQEALNKLGRKTMKDIPNPKGLKSNQLKEFSLFGANCFRYL